MRQRRKLTLALTTLPRCNETTGTIEMTPPRSHARAALPRAWAAAEPFGGMLLAEPDSEAL